MSGSFVGVETGASTMTLTKCGRLCRHWRGVDVRWAAGFRQKVVASGAELGFMNFGNHFFWRERNLGTFWIQSFTNVYEETFQKPVFGRRGQKGQPSGVASQVPWAVALVVHSVQLATIATGWIYVARMSEPGILVYIILSDTETAGTMQPHLLFAKTRSLVWQYF